MPRETPQRPVVIAGGGIGGLATAIALSRRGIASHVYEGRVSFMDEGAGIQIGPNGTRILRELGVAETLAPHVARPNAIDVRDGASARVIVELPLGPTIALRHGSPYWVAHRRDLHQALLATAQASPLIEMSLNATVSSVGRASGAAVSLVTATTTGGATRVEARALIAADGIWSDLRSTLFKSAAPSFAGRSAARAVIPTGDAPPELRAETIGVWLAPGAHVVHYPVRGGREIAIVVITTATEANRDWSRTTSQSHILERTRGFNPLLHRLLEAASSWRTWSLFTLPPLQRISDGPVALLGDAAHPVLPFLAQGGVMALEDAAVIARELAAIPDDATAAFARYQTSRLGRVARVAEASRRNGQIYHLDGALAAARNAAMRALGGSRILSGYDWLYGWRDAG